MKLMSKAAVAGFCLLIALAAVAVHADVAGARPAAALAFNPQPDPPGMSDEDFGFGRS